MTEQASATEIAAAVRQRSISSVEVARATLDRIAAVDHDLNSFTAVTAERALAEAEAVDRQIAAGIDPGPLAGVPFAVKNLFDIRGLPTLAGSIIRANAAPPNRDAAAIEALNKAGAVLVGALNMDEFAYGFVTENAHYGSTRNPHDLTRVAGGSSGGSAAAVAAGLAPITLGTDTNGSIRVPASFCGVFGLKPTYGHLPRAGAFLFASSLDTIGPFARTVLDTATAFDVMRGDGSTVEQLNEGIDGLRIALAAGYFVDPEALQANHAVERIAKALHADRAVNLPDPARARAAAFVITASEGGNHHLADLRSQPEKYDPNTRTRLMAGALAPAAWVSFAQRFRTWYREQMRALFEGVDVILAPATPCPAVLIGQKTMRWNGTDVPPRSFLGVFTQPVSFVGLPVMTVPVQTPGQLPIGVQLIAAPYRESVLLRVAARLEAEGVCTAPIAPLRAPVRS
jgi:AtzE family amidohydrolase